MDVEVKKAKASAVLLDLYEKSGLKPYRLQKAMTKEGSRFLVPAQQAKNVLENSSRYTFESFLRVCGELGVEVTMSKDGKHLMKL